MNSTNESNKIKRMLWYRRPRWRNSSNKNNRRKIRKQKYYYKNKQGTTGSRKAKTKRVDPIMEIEKNLHSSGDSRTQNRIKKRT